MLRPMTTSPTDLAKPKSIVAKHNSTLDKITGDMADLRVHTSQDGSKKYLRVWETPATGDKESARWYEIIEPADDPTKK